MDGSTSMTFYSFRISWCIGLAEIIFRFCSHGSTRLERYHVLIEKSREMVNNCVSLAIYFFISFLWQQNESKAFNFLFI